jgi:hypothetical protein
MTIMQVLVVIAYVMRLCPQQREAIIRTLTAPGASDEHTH